MGKGFLNATITNRFEMASRFLPGVAGTSPPPTPAADNCLTSSVSRLSGVPVYAPGSPNHGKEEEKEMALIIRSSLITGTNLGERLNGTTLADTIYGLGGNDIINGGGGNDLIYGGPGLDKIDGGLGNDILLGGDGIDDVDGGIGDDRLYGGAGDDKVEGGDGNDVMFGDAGNDKIEGGNGNDLAFGGTGNDDMVGGAGNDVLYGDAGNDIVEGGTGNDRMYGGLGLDTFVFEIAGARDIVADFKDGEDRIDLTAYDFANANAAKAFAVQSGAHVVFNFGAGDMLTVYNVALDNLTGVDFVL